MTTEQANNDFFNKLSKVYDSREAANITDWVFENVTGLRRYERKESKRFEISEHDHQLINTYLKELLNHKPVQYILHEAWFYKMKLYVNENVLIPRPETEELVEWIIRDIKNNKSGNDFLQLEMLDIGTGSGCIAVSLKKELEKINISAIDVNEDALLVARKNAMDKNVAINFLKMDILIQNEWDKLDVYDVIVSNPPYIPAREKNLLAKNVSEFEPGIALFVSDTDPLIFYKKIAGFAKGHLKQNGKIYVEIHEQFAKEAEGIFLEYDFNTEIRKDIYGKERMIKAW